MSKRETAVLTVSILLLLFFFRKAFSPFLAGAALAFLLDLPAKRIEQLLSGIRMLTLRRAVAAALTILASGALLALCLIGLVPRITESISALSARFPVYLDTFYEKLAQFPLPKFLQNYLASDGLLPLEAIGKLGTSLLSGAWNVTRSVSASVVGSLSSAVTACIVCLYLLFCKHFLIRQCRTLLYVCLPPETAQRISSLTHQISATFTAYLGGRAAESLVLAVLCFLGLSLSGVPYALLLSLIIGVGNLIPFLGSLLSILPCLLLLLVIAPIKALWFLIFIVALQQFDNTIIYPRIVGGSVGLPAFWSVMAVLFGARVAGAAGAFLAVPCAAVLYGQLAARIRRIRRES